MRLQTQEKNTLHMSALFRTANHSSTAHPDKDEMSLMQHTSHSKAHQHAPYPPIPAATPTLRPATVCSSHRPCTHAVRPQHPAYDYQVPAHRTRLGAARSALLTRRAPHMCTPTPPQHPPSRGNKKANSRQLKHGRTRAPACMPTHPPTGLRRYSTATISRYSTATMATHH